MLRGKRPVLNPSTSQQRQHLNNVNISTTQQQQRLNSSTSQHPPRISFYPFVLVALILISSLLRGGHPEFEIFTHAIS